MAISAMFTSCFTFMIKALKCLAVAELTQYYQWHCNINPSVSVLTLANSSHYSCTQPSICVRQSMCYFFLFFFQKVTLSCFRMDMRKWCQWCEKISHVQCKPAFNEVMFLRTGQIFLETSLKPRWLFTHWHFFASYFRRSDLKGFVQYSVTC